MQLASPNLDAETPSSLVKPESKKDAERAQAKAARDAQRQARKAKAAQQRKLKENTRAESILLEAVEKAKEAEEQAKAVMVEIQMLQDEKETLESEKEKIVTQLGNERVKKRKEDLSQQLDMLSDKILAVDFQISEAEARAAALAADIAAVAADAIARSDEIAVTRAPDSGVASAADSGGVDFGIAGPLVGLAAAGILARQARMSSLRAQEAQQMRELQVELKVPVQEAKSEKEEKDNLLEQIKNLGPAGIISYALWEGGFWTTGGAIGLVAYYLTLGHWPDLSNAEDAGKVGAEAFAFVNLARFAVPLRIGLAIGTAPWVDKNIVKRFGLGKNEIQLTQQDNVIRRSKDVREKARAVQAAGQKSMPRIVLEGLGNLIKDPTGWYAGKDPSPLYSNLPSPEDIAREDLSITLAALNADMPKILRQDMPKVSDALAKDFKIISREGEPVQGLGQLRNMGEKFAASNDLQLRFNFVQEDTKSKLLPEFLVAHWNASFGIVKLPYWEIDWRKDTASWKDVPVDIDAKAEFHLNHEKLVDYVQMDDWLVNGQQFKLWPEPATSGLMADLPHITVREPDWSHFSPDFTAFDQTGLTGNWILPYNANQAMLQVLRNLHSQLSAAFKVDYQTNIERTIVSVSDGTLEPALISQWTYKIASDGNTQLPGGLSAALAFLPVFDGSPTTLAGSLVFRFNAEGKVSSMKIGPITANGSELRLPSINIPDLSLAPLST